MAVTGRVVPASIQARSSRAIMTRRGNRRPIDAGNGRRAARPHAQILGWERARHGEFDYQSRRDPPSRGVAGYWNQGLVGLCQPLPDAWQPRPRRAAGHDRCGRVARAVHASPPHRQVRPVRAVAVRRHRARGFSQPVQKWRHTRVCGCPEGQPVFTPVLVQLPEPETSCACTRVSIDNYALQIY